MRIDHDRPDLKYPTGPIAWMARHPVAANLLMFMVIVGGIVFALTAKQEVFPEFDLDFITVSVSYPGATPLETEQGIALAIEDEVQSIQSVKRVFSFSNEGGSQTFIELLAGSDTSQALQDVKNSVDSITSFPQDAERPLVSLLEPRREVLSLILSGDFDEATLRATGETVREELLLREGITLVELGAVRQPEIAIEIPQARLRAHGLTLGDVSQLVKRTALELPGGAVKTAGGEVLLRTQERRDFASEFEDIAILSRDDGSKLTLAELGEVIEGFEDSDTEAYFNGKRAVQVKVFRVGNQGPIEVSQEARQYMEELRPRLPAGMDLTAWGDDSEIFADRIELLVRNASLGLILVLILLGLFLEPRLAFWVMLGIPISMIGSFLFMPYSGASINMVSLFAFIVTLGIVVDDAVVVGEQIYQRREQGMGHVQAAVFGAREIAVPVVFAVLTNIAAFVPLFFIPGAIGKIFVQIPSITVAVFLISLIESLYVLPSHLAHSGSEGGFWHALAKPTRWFNRQLKQFIQQIYKPALTRALHVPYLIVSMGVAMLAISAGLVFGGFIQFSYFPRVDSDVIITNAQMSFGIPIEESRALGLDLVRAAQEVADEYGQDDLVKGIYLQIGSFIQGGGPAEPQGASGSHLLGVQVQLISAERRQISGVEFARRWREKLGPVSGLETISFMGSVQIVDGAPIELQLTHPDLGTLDSAATELANKLTKYAGVKDIDSGVALGKSQLSFNLTEAGRSAGLTVRDLADQVRHAFFGAEALRQQRRRNEVKVLVRLPEDERSSVNTVEELIVRSPSGGEIPLREAADIEEGVAYKVIERQDGRRRLTVSADVDDTIANAAEINRDIRLNLLPDLAKSYPGLSFSFAGEQQEFEEAFDSMLRGFTIAMFAVFALLAIPFASYAQPAIVMLSIPFGIVGAIIGHLLLGYEISFMSLMGIVALSGVVVNDSLVLVVTANRLRESKHLNTLVALRRAGVKRFRPILLTSLTTFFGLAPMIFETSMQARFLIPMAISLGFGILFSTAIILFIVPCVYLIVEGWRGTRKH